MFPSVMVGDNAGILKFEAASALLVVVKPVYLSVIMVNCCYHAGKHHTSRSAMAFGLSHGSSSRAPAS